MTTPLFGMTELSEASPLAHIIANTNWRILEANNLRKLASITLTAPPGSPAEGSVYWVNGTGTGAWAGHDNQIGIYIAGAWYWRAPVTGERWYNATGAVWVQWNGSAWV